MLQIIAKKYLNLNTQLIQTLRKNHKDRVAFMIDFASQKEICRATKLIGYFKEKADLPCGICDICLLKKQNLRAKEDFEMIKNNILNELELYHSINLDLFCKKYSSLKQELIMNLIRYLLDEGYLELNIGGDLIKKS